MLNTVAQGLPRYSWKATPVSVDPGARHPVPSAHTEVAARETASDSRAGVANAPSSNEPHIASTTALDAMSPASLPPIPSATK